MDSDDKLLTAKAEDLFSLCGKRCCAQFSDFLDGAEQAVITDRVIFPFGYHVMLFGGFDDAEKKIMGVFPEWEEPDTAAFPLTCIRIDNLGGGTLTHRDYLGTVMSLGIKSGKLGDIVVSEDAAYIFLHRDIAGYVTDNIHKIGNKGVKVSEISDISDIRVERRYKTISAVCASARLDAVCGAAANVSRTVSAGLIEGGKVKVNHREIYKTSETVKEGDLLSIRGYGRFMVDSFGNETRKNRIHIMIRKYI